MKQRLLVCLLCAVIITACKKDKAPDPNVKPPTETNKKFSVATVLQSNMVIQRDKPIKIWGLAKAGSKVTISLSQSNEAAVATASATGEWEAVFAAQPANTNPQNITITAPDGTILKLENILIGDVWVCSGQSNMVMPVGPLAPSFAGVENYAAEIAAANYPQIRSFKVKEDYEGTPLADFATQSVWRICSPATVGELSATAYFFARKLHTDLHVPIGIIIAAINGSWCETWANKGALKNDPLLKEYIGRNQSSELFNGMVAPLTKLPIKGFTWYQGENNQNTNPASNYTKLNSALIEGWRSQFNQGELPFYYVQITPFDDGNTGNPTLNYLARFREAQMNIRNSVSGAGMVVTMDAGEVANHHPRYKKQVGERLALLALNKTYNKNISCVGPQYASFTANGNTATVNFAPGTANGLTTLGGNPINQFFFVAGADEVFRQATAVISGDKIILTAPGGMPLPVTAVRYAFTNFPVTNLQNSAGLPMEPLRTDNRVN